MSNEAVTGSVESLEVYRRAFALLKPVHDAALRFPDIEKFALADQMRRACKSVSANIAEGYGRRSTPKEFCRFLDMAVGSANEMEAHLSTACVLGYMPETDANRLLDEYRIVGKQLTKLIQYWRSRISYKGA